MYVRPQDQGQIVEVSYGYNHDGTVYRRVLDRSDNTETWYLGELDWDLEPEYPSYAHIPQVEEWIACSSPNTGN